MVRLTGILLLVLLPSLLMFARGSDESASKIFPYPINQFTLDNGLKIISIPFDSPGLIAYYTVVRTGSRNEVEPGKSGFAHFFEHMMFRGTEKYPAEKFNNVLKSIGADNNAFTSDDQTIYHTFASAAALEQLMDIESDRFMNLKYNEEDFKTESGAILGEYNKGSSNPFQTIEEKMRDAAFQVHTYKHTTIGFLKDIIDMPNQYEYSIKFFDRWYRPENCVVIIVGDFDQKKLADLAKKYYGNWKRGGYKLDIPPEPLQKQEIVVKIPWKARTLPILAIGYHGPAFNVDQTDMAAMDLLSQLYFSETSSLYRKLVVEDQIVDEFGADNSDHRDPCLFEIFARVKDEKNVEKVRDAIYTTLEEAKSTPISDERLSSTKSHVKYAYAMGLDNANSVAGSIAHYVELTGNPESVNQIYAMYEKITPADIMNAAKKYFSPTNRTVAILTQEAKEGQK